MIQYIKDQWIDQQHHNEFQWDQNSQNIVPYDNELKFIYLLREQHISFGNYIFININFVLKFLTYLRCNKEKKINQITILDLRLL